MKTKVSKERGLKARYTMMMPITNTVTFAAVLVGHFKGRESCSMGTLDSLMFDCFRVGCRLEV